MSDPEPKVREAAAAALGRQGVGARAAVEPLVSVLGHEDAYLRGVAADALSQIGEAAVPALTRSLGHDNPKVRHSAAIALGRMGAAGRAAAPELMRSLSDSDGMIRYAAVVALGEFGPSAREAGPALTQLLSDREEAVRRAATQALDRVAPDSRRSQLTLPALAATLDRLVPLLMGETHVPGVSIAIIQDRQVTWSKGYGVRRAGSREPVTRDTVFEAASMSKPIFGLVAMQLVDQQRLELDRPLVAYGEERFVPDVPEKRRVTARMVLSHTSGFPNWRPGGEELEGPIPLLFQPGSRFTYSGEGIFYLQRRIEYLTGQPLDQWAERSLFGPLGLTSTGYAWTPALGSRLASGHRDDGSVLTTSAYRHPNAAYTLYTTAEEYARLLVEMLRAEQGRSSLLSRQAAQEMLKHQVAVGSREPMERPGVAQGLQVYWGLGWSLNTTAQGDIAHHSGANSTGFRCFSQFSPSRGTGLVILTNGTQGGELWTRLIAAIGDL
ncbi:serine hydrolase [Geothrix sp. PMB-07]|uniref:serine hydrolase n=1 Tax=Geothrix sp. PMB-07 TaxID=3068640 RepID=UPI0027412AD8|nr:serine hydrolase [Geothrix sp. PMB-07]WLT32029.1 serine hydrolase [Geothrix sp. PMB-07]